MRSQGLVDRPTILTALVICFVAAGALHPPSASLAADSQSTAETSSPDAAEATGPVDFELPDSKGDLHKLSDLRGRWVLVNFWATWCTPCVTEIPIIQTFVDAHADTLSAVGINFEEIDRPTLQQAIEALDIRYLVVQAGEAPIVPFEPLKGLPSTFFVSPEGRLVYRHTGELSEPELTTAWQAAKAQYGEDAGNN